MAKNYIFAGPENNFGYAYNTAPPQDGRFALQPQQGGHPVEVGSYKMVVWMQWS